MNSIVTLKQLTAMLTRAAGVDVAVSTRFIDEFTRAVAIGLECDGKVDIPGFGTFARDGIAGEHILFIPADSVAAAINAPFDMFEPVELDDNYTEPVADNNQSPYVAETMQCNEIAVDTPEVDDRTVEPEPDVTVQVPEPEPDRQSEPEPVYMPDEESEPAVQKSAEPEVQPAAPYDRHIETDYDDVYEEPHPEPRRKHRGFGAYVLMLIGFVMLSFIIGTVAGYFAHPMLNKAMGNQPEDNNAVKTESVVKEAEVLTETDPEVADETVPPADEQPSEPAVEDKEPAAAPEVVTDTVEAGNSLAKIAKRHYGNSDFWVYIYLANEDKLSDPDHIASGTILVIPPASQYDIDASDKESISRARAKISEVMNRKK